MSCTRDSLASGPALLGGYATTDRALAIAGAQVRPVSSGSTLDSRTGLAHRTSSADCRSVAPDVRARALHLPVVDAIFTSQSLLLGRLA